MTHPTDRYHTLDAWRGIAALAVVVFHCSNTIVTADTLVGRVLLSGWLGVFVFFPVSGYCIAAALQSPANRTFGRFLTRRWRRIMPPYWASIAVAVAIGLAALPFNDGSPGDLLLRARDWAAVLTLTQVFTSHANAINPVYWSLCYEEQFYIVMALLLFAPAKTRPVAIAAITAAAALYSSPVWPWRLDGLFLEYWMCFAAGCAGYLWLHDRSARGWAAITIAAPIAMGIAMRNAAVMVSAATAVAIALLARYDTRLARTRIVSLLIGVGTFSFSLYLVHVPIGGRVTNLLGRTDLPTYLIVSISTAVSLAAASAFYVVVENRSRPARHEHAAAQPRAVPVVAQSFRAAVVERT